VHFYIKRGMHVAQLVIVPVVQVNFKLKSELSNTQRGEMGFGSTGF